MALESVVPDIASLLLLTQQLMPPHREIMVEAPDVPDELHRWIRHGFARRGLSDEDSYERENDENTPQHTPDVTARY